MSATRESAAKKSRGHERCAVCARKLKGHLSDWKFRSGKLLCPTCAEATS